MYFLFVRYREKNDFCEEDECLLTGAHQSSFDRYSCGGDTSQATSQPCDDYNDTSADVIALVEHLSKCVIGRPPDWYCVYKFVSGGAEILWC